VKQQHGRFCHFALLSAVEKMPVALVTNYLPPYRLPLYELLAEKLDVEVYCFGGEGRYVPEAGRDLERQVATASFPAHVLGRQRDAFDLAERNEAVIAGVTGRVALPAAYRGAMSADRPFILWASLWRHPRTPPHALSFPLMRRIYRNADAIVTYGPHVSGYVRSKGARRLVVEAPQSVDDAFWSGPGSARKLAPYQVAFVGRLAREKGVAVLLRAWRASGLSAPNAALVLVGGGPFRARAVATGAVLAGELPPVELRNFYAGSDVVVVPSIPTRDFREPWGLVVNEAFNQGVPVIATDAVGAVAGGLVRHERPGLVVPAGDADALATALRRLHDDAPLRARLGAAAREAVRPFNHGAWAAGVSRALAAVGASRRQEGC
jgi:glycosyltransferase involved in cell wall biosynthesis